MAESYRSSAFHRWLTDCTCAVVWLKPDHLRRYRDLATLLMKYGRSDLLASAGLDAEELLADPGEDRPAEDDTG